MPLARRDEPAVRAMSNAQLLEPAALRSPGFIIMAATSGYLLQQQLVPPHCWLFALLWPTYLAAVHVFRFDSNRQFAAQPRTPLSSRPWIPQYAALAGVLGLLLPLLLLLLPSPDPTATAEALAPHLFLTCVQVGAELVMRTWALLPRLLNPIGFNTYRMWVVVEWARAAAALSTVHAAVAGANVVFWAFNLFFLLLLLVVPEYLDPTRCAT